MKKLRGKVAAVTGAASGIGLGMARRFGAEGMKLVLADIEPGPLETAAEELRGSGHEVLTVQTDVSDAEQMDRLAERTLDHFGGVHIVCNNAGVGAGGVMWELSTEDWQYAIGANLWGVIHGVRVFVKHLVAQNEGHVVNTASMAGLVSIPGVGPYNVTKHGVVTLSETLLGELSQAAPNVGVSVLCPGFVNTRIFESDRNRPEELRNATVDANDPELAERREMAAKFFSTAMSTEEVANQVLDAVRESRLYILTHPGSLAAVELRMRAIIAGENPEVISPEIFATSPRPGRDPGGAK